MKTGTMATNNQGTAAIAGAKTGRNIQPQRPPVRVWIIDSTRLPIGI